MHRGGGRIRNAMRLAALLISAITLVNISTGVQFGGVNPVIYSIYSFKNPELKAGQRNYFDKYECLAKEIRKLPEGTTVQLGPMDPENYQRTIEVGYPWIDFVEKNGAYFLKVTTLETHQRVSRDQRCLNLEIILEKIK